MGQQPLAASCNKENAVFYFYFQEANAAEKINASID